MAEHAFNVTTRMTHAVSNCSKWLWFGEPSFHLLNNSHDLLVFDAETGMQGRASRAVVRLADPVD